MADVVQWLARQLVELKMGVQFPSPAHMSNEQDKYYIVSTNGKSGPVFNVVQRYIQLGGQSQVTRLSDQIPDQQAVINVQKRSNSKGELYLTTARSKKKVDTALFKPSQETEFKKYIESRNPSSGKIDPETMPTTSMPPVEYTMYLLLAELAKQNQEVDPVERQKKLIIETSYFPPQNLDEMLNRFAQKTQQCLPIRIGCFACLNMKCVGKNFLPKYYVGQEESRLESPRIIGRTNDLVRKLRDNKVDYNLEFLLADTDVYDVYGNYLINKDNTKEIRWYSQKLARKITNDQPDSKLSNWSDIQSPYQRQYQKDFDYVYNNCEKLVGKEYLERSYNRRYQYFRGQVGLPDSESMRFICYDTAKRNVALYAAQGPVLNKEFDCILIADPDPTRMGMLQSLLCPDLPIWYAFPG